ncbi:ArsA family ATPase [Pseudomonas sp. N040]|uniref:ArsA family ATPase n=1 Tax=Pseudomonas sp. N040 TaxID=2785325 RepID=UPI0018A2CD8C|nr:ArsA-related P-loop ATPase [Pseudomonas sp. N040]MBF7731540.1 ArsA family ATPase [Pseudomonas sp. N040]MBW7015184.1 AAA family ATPase [Pseudomonas sp. N040]
MKALLENHRVIVCTGSGGVGKTTTSAALGIAAAKLGKRVLVLTIDPARRLATSLGIDNSAEDVRVPGQHFAGELYAGMIDPARIFADYIERHSESRAAAQRLLDTVLYQQLSTTLSGSQEFTSLARLHEAATSGDYDLVILDTPPAAHAVDFLLTPEKLNAVFDSTIVSMFMGRAAGFGLAATAWKQGVKMILGTLTFLTGSEFVRNFTDFFAAIDAIAPEIRRTNLQAQQLLLDPSTAFVLISSFDAAKIQEGEAFHDQLLEAGYHLRKVIVNRAWPQWSQGSAAAQAAVQKSLRAAHARELAACHARLLAYYAARRTLHTRFAEILSVPEMDGEMIGLPALERLASRLVEQG